MPGEVVDRVFHGTPIEILEIRPVGTRPAGGYQPMNKPLSPASAMTPRVRAMPSASGGMGGGTAAVSAGMEEDR